MTKKGIKGDNRTQGVPDVDRGPVFDDFQISVTYRRKETHNEEWS